MLGLTLVVVAVVGSLLVRALNAVIRGGREFRVDVEDLVWYAIALALVTNFYGLIPSSLYSTNTAINTIDGLLSAYNGLIGSLGMADAVLSVVVNVGLPIAEAAMYVVAGSGLGSIILVIDVIEHLVTLAINYVVHVLSTLVAALWFTKYAVLIGGVLRLFMPYMAPLLVIPRVRSTVAIPVALYLILGVALPLGINTTYSSPVISMPSTMSVVPINVGFINIEVVDEWGGRSVPSVLCINGYGFTYSEVVGLPNGVGLIALPIYTLRIQPILYKVNCVVVLFMRFDVNYLIAISPGFNNRTVFIRLPLIAVFNGDSLVALFNYEWNGIGNAGGVNVNDGYAVINVTTPCSGNITVIAYASQVLVRPINPIGSNCSITYSTVQGTPTNIVPQSWINSIIRNHELFCQDLEQVLNPSIIYQGTTAPQQVVSAILGIVNESCGGLGNYTSAINELRSFRVTASLTCRGTCNETVVSIVIIGIKPYRLNYYALWDGSYITWLNDSLMIIKNAGLNPFNLGTLIRLYVNTTYYSALFLGIIGLAAMTPPRIRRWLDLMSIVKIRPNVHYEDVIAVVSPLISKGVKGRVEQGDSVRRYARLRRVYEILRYRYVRHALRAGYWAVRDLPRIAVAPHVLLPALYGVSLSRECLMRRVSTIERESLRVALRSAVSTVLSPSLVLRPYSLTNPLLRQGINALGKYVGLKVSDASRLISP